MSIASATLWLHLAFCLAPGIYDWYAVRPVKLTDGPLTGSVRSSDKVRLKSISRADVAWHVLSLAEDPAPGPRRTPVITTGPTLATHTGPHPGGRTSRRASAAS